MNKLIAFILLSVLFVFICSAGAEAKMNIFGQREKIVSNACVMSYTDIGTQKTMIVLGNPVEIYINRKGG